MMAINNFADGFMPTTAPATETATKSEAGTQEAQDFAALLAASYISIPAPVPLARSLIQPAATAEATNAAPIQTVRFQLPAELVGRFAAQPPRLAPMDAQPMSALPIPVERAAPTDVIANMEDTQKELLALPAQMTAPANAVLPNAPSAVTSSAVLPNAPLSVAASSQGRTQASQEINETGFLPQTQAPQLSNEVNSSFPRRNLTQPAAAPLPVVLPASASETTQARPARNETTPPGFPVYAEAVQLPAGAPEPMKTPSSPIVASVNASLPLASSPSDLVASTQQEATVQSQFEANVVAPSSSAPTVAEVPVAEVTHERNSVSDTPVWKSKWGFDLFTKEMLTEYQQVSAPIAQAGISAAPVAGMTGQVLPSTASLPIAAAPPELVSVAAAKLPLTMAFRPSSLGVNIETVKLAASAVQTVLAQPETPQDVPLAPELISASEVRVDQSVTPAAVPMLSPDSFLSFTPPSVLASSVPPRKLNVIAAVDPGTAVIAPSSEAVLIGMPETMPEPLPITAAPAPLVAAAEQLQTAGKAPLPWLQEAIRSGQLPTEPIAQVTESPLNPATRRTANIQVATPPADAVAVLRATPLQTPELPATPTQLRAAEPQVAQLPATPELTRPKPISVELQATANLIRPKDISAVEAAPQVPVAPQPLLTVAAQSAPEGMPGAALILQPESLLAEAPDNIGQEGFDLGAPMQIAAPAVSNAAPPQTFTAAVVQPLVQQTVEPLLTLAHNVKPNEAQTLRFSLNPAELGRVEVEVMRDAEGHISAALTVEQSDTAQALTQGIRQLRESLEHAGLVVDQLQVTVQMQSQNAQQFGQQQPSQQQASSPANPKADSLPADILSADETTPASENKLLSLHA